MRSALPPFRGGGEKKLCLQQKGLDPDHDFPFGTPHTILGMEQGCFNAHMALLRGAAVSPCHPSCCSPSIPSSQEQLVALIGRPTLERDVSDLICKEGRDAP